MTGKRRSSKSSRFIVAFRGVRGSAPSADARMMRYGGDTVCLEVWRGGSARLILDCGSGLRSVNARLPRDSGPAGLEFHVFLTHYHWDHVQGLPFLDALYDPRNRFTFWGPRWQGAGVQEVLEQFMSPPWFPVRLQETPSAKAYRNLQNGTVEVEGIRVTASPLHHPQGALGYRLERAGRSIVLATDVERGVPRADAAFRYLARGADVLIHDAQYTPEEYEARHRGWGHSSWKHAIEAAREAEARRLILFHHAPDRTDRQIDAIVKRARREFAAVSAAKQGMTLAL